MNDIPILESKETQGWEDVARNSIAQGTITVCIRLLQVLQTYITMQICTARKSMIMDITSGYLTLCQAWFLLVRFRGRVKQMISNLFAVERKGGTLDQNPRPLKTTSCSNMHDEVKV